MKNYNQAETLRKFLENVGIPNSYYSIGEYKEGAVCIENTEEGTIVYDAERAEKYRMEKYEKYGQAAFELISRIAMTKEDKKFLQNAFFEEIEKETLTEVLKHHNRLCLCSLEGYAEEAICMEKEENEYIVYEGERGNKYNLKRHPKIISAFCDIISRLAESDKEEGKMRHEFIEMLTKKSES